MTDLNPLQPDCPAPAIPQGRGQSAQQSRLIPPSKWSDYHAWPPIGGLRHLIFNAKKNGFDAVIRRVGRCVLIDEAAFFDWVESQNRGA